MAGPLRRTICAAVVMLLLCWPGTAHSVNISLERDVFYVDEPIKFKITDVPFEEATVHVIMQHSGKRHGWAEFAVVNGEIDPALQTPRKGSYSGVDPAGLFWSARVPEDHDIPEILSDLVQEVTTRDVIIVVERNKEILKIARIKYGVTHTGIKSMSVSDQYVRGFYAFPRGGPQSAKIGLLLIGGNPEFRSSISAFSLADTGLFSLDLDYHFRSKFQSQDRDRIVEVPMEHFESAIDWMRSMTQKEDLPVVVVGISKGAEMASILAAYSDKVQAAVLVSPPPFILPGGNLLAPWNEQSPWTVRGQKVDHLSAPWFDSLFLLGGSLFEDGPRTQRRWIEAVSGKQCGNNPILPTAKAKAPVLIMLGENDEFFPSDLTRACIFPQLQSGNSPVRMITFPGAGHELFGRGWVPLANDCVPASDILAEDETGNEPICEATALAKRHTFDEIVKFARDVAMRNDCGGRIEP